MISSMITLRFFLLLSFVVCSEITLFLSFKMCFLFLLSYKSSITFKSSFNFFSSLYICANFFSNFIFSTKRKYFMYLLVNKSI